MEVIDDLSKTETDNVYLVDFRIAGLNMTHLKHDHKSKPQGQQMPVETGKMTLTISKLRVPYKNKKLKKKCIIYTRSYPYLPSVHRQYRQGLQLEG